MYAGKVVRLLYNMYPITQVENSDEETAHWEKLREHQAAFFESAGELTGRSDGMNRKMHEEYVTKTRSCLMTPIL